ncbi:MAG: sulfatase-like hydrolase/transferase [Clostridia bacterium]|nr:sulfatase-like hydrolase/transferase [Clostridia bacterium]
MKRTDSMRQGVGKKAMIPPALFVIGESLLLTFVLEILSRRNFMDACRFVYKSPLLFLYGCSIVSVTLAIAMLFRKKVFSTTLVTVLWLAFGIADCVLLGFRNNYPLTAVDLQMGLEAIMMMPVYFKIWQIVLIFVVGAGAIAGLVVLAIKSPKYRKEGQRGVLRACLFVMAFLIYTLVLFTRPSGVISRNLKPDLYSSYKKYGFPYCFCYSFFNVGIEKPADYSPKEVADIADTLDIEIDVDEPKETHASGPLDEFIEAVRSGDFASAPEGYTRDAVDSIREILRGGAFEQADGEHPNILFVQLESFFDPMTVKTVTLSEDPIPNFRSLQENCIGGYLSVPTVSGGTANTEFEVLTGCSLDFFGAGEFPYYSILRKEALETLATDLRALKYTATGVHNYTGSFYYRNTIYKNMGFNRFHSKEYMNGFELNPKGWCKDNILTDEILKAVRQTEGRDFVYTVTMQTHGAYIPLPADMEPVVTVEGAKSEREKSVFEYYLSQIVETDQFVGDLVEAFENYDEKTIIVFFGDHLPGLSLTEDDLTTGDMYKTPYVIWANYALDGESCDLEAYQLGAYVLEQAKIDTGVMVRFHQREMGSENYQRNLEMLEYDMLYGERYVYESVKHAYDESFMMGLKPVRVTSLENRFGNLFVHGEGLTYASRVYVNDKAYDTVPVDDTLIIVPDFIPEDGSLLAVAQVSDEGIELSRTAETVCEGLKPVEYDD